MRQNKRTLEPKKCIFLQKEAEFLGHRIGGGLIKTSERKIQAAKEYPRPRNQKGIRQFLGFVGYYRRFIRNFAAISRPLNNLLKTGVDFVWGENEEKAFQTLKDALISDPILVAPDFSKPFLVTTDTCDYGLGAILSQGEIGKDRVN